MMTTQKEAPEPVMAAGAGYAKTIETDKIIAGSDFQLFAMLKARAAKKGHALIKVVDGFLLSRWGQTCHCPDMAALVIMLARMGC